MNFFRFARQLLQKRFVVALLVLLLLVYLLSLFMTVSVSTNHRTRGITHLPPNISVFVEKLFADNGVTGELLTRVKAHLAQCPDHGSSELQKVVSVVPKVVLDEFPEPVPEKSFKFLLVRLFSPNSPILICRKER